MHAVTTDLLDPRPVARREWLVLALGWSVAIGVVVMDARSDRFGAIPDESTSQASHGPSAPQQAASDRSLAESDGDAIVSEIESLIDSERDPQVNWRGWDSVQTLPRPSKEKLLQHAVATERTSLSLGRTDWKVKSKMLAVAGTCYAAGGADSPKYLERGADALVASADLARENGLEDFAVGSYEQALLIYDKLLELIGPASSELRARVTRKRAFIEEEFKRPVVEEDFKRPTVAPTPVASMEVVG
jgi:hypothetical protein